MKVCSKCGIEKELITFSKNKTNKDGLQYSCKVCDGHYHKKWYLTNKKYHLMWMKKWRTDNKEYLKSYEENRPNKKERVEYNKMLHQQKKPERLEKQHEYHRKHRNEIIGRQIANRDKNGIKYNAHHKEYRHTEKGLKAVTRARIKRQKKRFGSNLLFENILDESEKIAFHHIDKNNGVFIPDDLHRLYNHAQDVKRHRENLNPVIKQLYPTYEWDG